MFDSGVSSYVVARATVEVCFPVDHRGVPHVCCSQCEYHSTTSNRCKLNGSICEFPDRYIGSRCPLQFEENEEKEINE